VCAVDVHLLTASLEPHGVSKMHRAKSSKRQPLLNPAVRESETLAQWASARSSQRILTR
jgi:hypothetical protein